MSSGVLNSGLSIKKTRSGGVDITFTVKNTGTRAGAEVPQVYLGPSLALVQQAVNKLADLERIELDPGQSQKV